MIDFCQSHTTLVKTPPQLSSIHENDFAHPTHPTTTAQELYSRPKDITRQCQVTHSLTIISYYLRQLSNTIIDNYLKGNISAKQNSVNI